MSWFKNISITKTTSISFEKFTKYMKTVSSVYHNGYHHWSDSNGYKFYSFVVGQFRVILTKYSQIGSCNI